MVPAVLRGLVSGRPQAGSVEQVFLLVTAGRNHEPGICLLSRAEIEADDTRLYTAISARGARADLERETRATLLACHGVSLHVCRLEATRTISGDDMVGIAFEVRHHTRDSVGVRLIPLSYHCAASLRTEERWDEAERLLSELIKHNL